MKINIAAPLGPRSARHAAAAIIFLMVSISSFLAIESLYAEKVEISRLLTSSVASLDYQTDRSFRAIDDLLNDASGRIDPMHEPDTSLVSWFRGRLSAFPEIRNILVVKANGQSVSSGLTVDGTTGQIIDVSDREYFQYHHAHPEDHGIHIGEGIVSRLDGQFGLPVSRAIYDAEGKFAGVVRALVSPQFLTKGLAVLRARNDGFSVLLRSDGKIIAQAPVPGATSEKPLIPPDLFRTKAANGTRETVSPQTGETLILATGALEHYPLIVVSGVPKWAALSEWETRSYWVLGLLMGLSLALYSGAVWSDRRERLRASSALAAQQAEIDALRAQQQFLDAIETISDGFAFYDSEDRLVVSNAQYRSMFAGAEDVIQPGNRFADIVRVVGERGIYGFEGRALESFLSARIAEHSAPTGRALLHPIKGGRWIVSKEFRTYDGGVVATRTDVTELRRREEEIEALKKRYELILDSAGDGIIGISADETISFANHTACRMLETSVNALNGQNYRKALYGSTVFAELPPFPIPNDLAGSRETSFLHSDGSNFIAEYVLAPIHQDDVFQGAVLVFRDISLRKRYEAGLADHQKELENQVAERTQKLSSEIEQRSRTEEALRKSQGRLQGITANLFEGVLLVDVYGHILFANHSAHRLLVDGGRQLAGTDIDNTLNVLRDDVALDFIRSPFHQAIESGETVIDDDAEFMLTDQRRISVGFAVAPLEEEGKRRGAVISFRSIEALKLAQWEAEQSSRLASVGQLAAGIAHEINTPIQYVGDNLCFMRDSFRIFTEAMSALKSLVKGTDRAPEFDQFYRDKDIDYLLEEFPQATLQSLQGVEHVAHIVRSMKEFSHPGTSAKVATDLNHAIDSTITVSSNEWKQLATIETDLDPNLPAVVCFPADINQVFLNLIVNAAHAIESAKPEKLGLIRVSSRLDGDYVEIRVSDSGPGVPKAIRDKIFDPFFTTKSVGKGTGQGLSIALGIVINKHGGKLFIDDSNRVGATFVVRLPIGDCAQKLE